MKPLQNAVAFVVLIGATVALLAGLWIRLRHIPVKACVEITEDGSMITYPPLKGYCVPEPRPKSQEATQ